MRTLGAVVFHMPIKLVLVLAVTVCALGAVATDSGASYSRKALDKKKTVNQPKDSEGSTQVRKVAVVLLRFEGEIKEWPVDVMREFIFTGPISTSAFFQASSSGKMTLGGRDNPDGDFYGPYLIPGDKRRCHPNLWKRLANRAVSNAGQNLSGYDHVLYFWPYVRGCISAAAAYKGRTSYYNLHLDNIDNGRIWRLVAHELSHNLGLSHANYLACKGPDGEPVPISDTCTIKGYFDLYDPMGASSLADRHPPTWLSYEYHNWHKMRLGFIPWDNASVVRHSGTYVLEPSEQEIEGATQALLIPRRVNSLGRPIDYYVLDFRQPSDPFDNFDPDDPAVNGVTIRIQPNHELKRSEAQYLCNEGSLLISAHPDEVDQVGRPMNAPFGVGEVFSDPRYEVEIKPTAISPLGVTVEISLADLRRNNFEDACYLPKTLQENDV